MNKQKINLILRLIEALHSVNIASDGIESRMSAIARRLGGELRILTLQSYATVEFITSSASVVHICRFPFNTHWNLRKMNDLLELSDAFVARSIDESTLAAELNRIVARGQLYKKSLVVLCYAVYGAAVATRVGGAGLEMAVAAVVGTVAGLIHFGTIRSRRIDLQKSFLASFLGTLTAFALTLVFPSFDLSRAVFGGITLLVPAMVVTIGTHELVSEAVESGLARLSYGLVRFLMMAFGVSAAATLWSAVGNLPGTQVATRLPFVWEFPVVAIGGLALMFCMQGRRRDLLWIVSGVLIAFSVQEWTKLVFGGNGSPFITSFVLGLAGVLMLGRRGRPPHLLVMPGLLQIAPGFIGHEAILALLSNGTFPGSGESFFRVLLSALQIVFGLAVAALFSGAPRRT